MKELGNKITAKRKDLGMTQSEFAEKLFVTRQTVSRWEAGTVMPDIEKIADIAKVLDVSCDYLLKDDTGEETVPGNGVSTLLNGLIGKKVKLSFFEDEHDIDLYNLACTVAGFEGNWMRVTALSKKGKIEKLIPLSSILSFELLQEDE